MLDRDEVLKIVDNAYALRVQGDKAAIAEIWADNATYGLGADPSLLPRLPAGPSDAEPAVSDLIDLFTFHTVERVDAIVEGNRAAIVWNVELSRAGGGERTTTQISQLWAMTDDGKVQSLREYGDTALITRLLT